jgi:CRP/FNR family transcriptional regulator
MMNKISSVSTLKPALSTVPYFAGLDERVLESIAAITVQRHYAMGEIVFLEGEPCQGLYVVQEGWLKSVITSTGGREQIIRLVGPGQAFNEIGVLLRENRNLVTVQATEPSAVWVINRQALLNLMDENPVLCRTITQSLADRVVNLMKLVEDLSLRTVEGRLARLLIDQSIGEGMRRHWATQAEMASRLGTVPDVINRALHKLEAEGLIRIVRHQIEIVDHMRLEQRAETRD